MICYLLEVLLTSTNTPPDCPKELYELYFVFACIWAFGGAMFQDQLVDYRYFAASLRTFCFLLLVVFLNVSNQLKYSHTSPLRTNSVIPHLYELYDSETRPQKILHNDCN